MALNKKIVIPLVVILIALAVTIGWLLWQNLHSIKATTGQTAQHTQLYTCSMHPYIIKDKPGLCPICGMELIKKIEINYGKNSSVKIVGEQTEITDHVDISTHQRIMANVATIEARTEPLNKEINTVGIVQYDQSRQAKVTSWIAGRIEKLHINSIGTFISKEKPVAEIYSPDIVAAQQEYLLAIKSRNQMKNSPISSISENGEGLVSSARQRLKLFGLKETQIGELEQSGKPNMKITIYTPLSGMVIEKMVQLGQYVNTGEVLFNIADLSRVWVELEVYENEVSSIHPGQQVEIRSQSFPGETFTGKISFIYPFLDPKTRTVRARVEMANPGMKFKPEMFVNAVIKIPLGQAIVLPISAVIDTGIRQVVWVESAPGMFEPRNVMLGHKSTNTVQILSGINLGDKVAISGGYLIDSESQLKGNSEGHKTIPTATGQNVGVPPAQKKPANRALLK
ncbi:MAG: efflux RND transporter periplasmic adaptor subunit [Chlorobiaceae bacterium]